MADYWLGLLTIPATVGALAGLAGLWWAVSKALNWLVICVPARRDDLDARMHMAAVVARARRTYLLRVCDHLGICLCVGRVDQLGGHEQVYRAIRSAIDPPPDLVPTVNRRTRETDRA